MELRISMNPVINSFQHTVHKYNISDGLIRSFMESMKADLHKKTFFGRRDHDYIYGSAEAVGLMCLQVFVDGDKSEYDRLKPYARG